MLSNILQEIKEAELEFDSNDIIWYRGHNNAAYSLLPSLYRTDKISCEADLYYDFKNFSASLNKHRSHWELLLDMQHYGIPTRMLDWTGNLGAALFFALKDANQDSAIWLLSPFELNNTSVDLQHILDVDSINDNETGDLAKFSVFDLITKNNEVYSPFAIEPKHSNRRLAAQRGSFTVHGKETDPLEKQYPDAVKKITIPKELISELRENIKLLGIDDFLLFPDYQGLSSHLIKKYNL